MNLPYAILELWPGILKTLPRTDRQGGDNVPGADHGCLDKGFNFAKEGFGQLFLKFLMKMK